MAGLTLWLLRHAEVPAGRGRCYGRLDLAADEAQTRRAALAFEAGVAGDAAVPAWTSPLLRCRQIAQALRQPRWQWQGLDARLAELDFGHWEGRLWGELNAADFAPWMDDFAAHAVGGGESVQALLVRVRAALDATQAHCVAGGHTQALWVSHAGVARALTLLLQGRTVRSGADWPADAPAPGQWQAFTLPAASAAAPPA